MTNTFIAGKTLEEWQKTHPIINNLCNKEEVFWTNPSYSSVDTESKNISLTISDILDAEQRLKRFAPYISKVFPDTAEAGGIIESPLREISQMRENLNTLNSVNISGKLLLKCDSHLAISGSIKARGGIYEVLKYAETLAIKNGMLKTTDNYSIICEDKFKNFFAKHAIAVGSTGNLGLSIGIMSAKLGFKVFVHMSADAKKWKKEMLRSKGVNVIEYKSDYSKAVEEGRKQAESDPMVHFIDDENSADLFLGYSVAALRIKKQLEDLSITVDSQNPLFVYLPCGVGGGPGGITFGLKNIFKDNVHCFFAEPTNSPCMLLGLLTGLHEKISVRDIGLDNVTDADGLAVATPSGFVGKTIGNLISGAFTAKDKTMYKNLKILADTEDIWLEPSALAGMEGVVKLLSSENGRKYLTVNNLADKMNSATHIVWATGGSMVPEETMKEYYKLGENI